MKVLELINSSLFIFICRSRFRTPMTNSRLNRKSTSVDTGLNPITPKYNANSPLTMLRYAKAGEHVISLTGSPVIPAVQTQSMANVNIPISNGVLSLRSSKMQSVNPELLTKIDTGTISELKQLQSNLNQLMRMFE